MKIFVIDFVIQYNRTNIKYCRVGVYTIKSLNGVSPWESFHSYSFTIFFSNFIFYCAQTKKKKKTKGLLKWSVGGTESFSEVDNKNIKTLKLQTKIAQIRHFRPKLVCWNESVHCTPIDRTLKMRFNEGSGSFLRPTVPELWGFLWNQLRRFLDKINTQI